MTKTIARESTGVPVVGYRRGHRSAANRRETLVEVSKRYRQLVALKQREQR